MIQSNVQTYNRQDTVIMKLVLWFLFSPLVILLAFASVLSI